MFKRQRWQVRILSFLLVLIMVLQDGAAMAVRAEAGDIPVMGNAQTDTKSEEKETGEKEDNAVSENTGISEGEENAGDQKIEDKKTSDEGDTDTGELDAETDIPNDTVDKEPDTDTKRETYASGNEIVQDVSGNDVPEDISGNDLVLREPENYYPEGDEEDYGELVAYDAYSRTYLTGEAPAASQAETGEKGQAADEEAEKASYVTVVDPSASYYIDEEGELQETDNTLSTGKMARYALGSISIDLHFLITV